MAIFGVLIGVGLLVAPVALAQGDDTITPAAGVQYNGIIDSDPSCTTATTVTITWGDGTATSAGRYTSGGSDVIGTHTYARTGTYTGSVAFTGVSCDIGNDPFTATVGPTPAFTECPQVGEDTGCQFLIVASNSGTTINNDSAQGPYEGQEDSLIGVVNNSSDPISSIPLSAPGSGLFSFDGDGICDAFTEVSATAPFPIGCEQIGSAAGTPCDPTLGSPPGCAYPPAPGETTADPDALSGTSQNGYEGPTTYFTSVSTDLSSGVVNFSPALQPGQSTYFTLEEPPVNGLAAGGGPGGGTFAAPPTVSATGANFTATVNPNGAPTTVTFQYGLDGNYGIATSPFSQSTPAQNIGGDFANHVVNASAAGLVPNAIYDVRVVATNKNGSTLGPTLLFSTKKAAPPGTPTLGKTFNASTVSGLVLIEVNGKFVPLTELRQIPANTVIDALGGTVKIVSSSGGVAPANDARAAKKPKKSKAPKTVAGTFGGAVFKVTQTRSGGSKGQTTLTIVEGASFKGAPTYASCSKKGSADAHAALSSRVLQTLRSKATGRYSTRGRYAAGTVRGTQWTTSDRCNGTQIAVQVHSVEVTNLVTHKTTLVTAGHHYLALAPTKKHK